MPDVAELNESVVNKIIEGACSSAKARNLALSIAIVDDGGTLRRFIRLDGSRTATVEVAIAKARSAALFRNSGKKFGEMLAGGSLALLKLPNLLPIDGSEPIVIGDIALGGIGVSGSSPENDGEVARAGIAALQVKGRK